MSTTFAVILKNGEQHDVARRVGRGILGCELFFTNEITELMPDETPVTPTDNSAQGIFTIGDIREHIRKQNEATAAGEYYSKQPYNEDAFIEGVKWQQEQDKNKYSEEEVLQILFRFTNKFDLQKNIEITVEMQKEWFEQFKKK